MAIDGNEETIKAVLKALNEETNVARTTWVSFLTAMLFTAITAMGITHVDLLFNKPVKLPFVDTGIPLTYFAVLAPAFIVILHLALLLQHSLLARKAIAFNDVLVYSPNAEAEEYYRHQAGTISPTNIVQSQPNRTLRFGLRAISWLTLDLLPLLLLIFIQLQFLPYQSTVITWLQRIFVLSDVALIFSYGLSRRQPNTNIGQAYSELMKNNRFAAISLSAVCVIASIATLTMAVGLQETNLNALGIGRALFLFSSDIDPVLNRTTTYFSQRLVVQKLSQPEEDKKKFPPVFRGRNFIEAKFNDSNLDNADFSGSRLERADFSGSKLKSSNFDAANLIEANFSNSEHATDLSEAKFGCIAKLGQRDGVAFIKNTELFKDYSKDNPLKDVGCSVLAGASFSGAKLQASYFSNVFAPNADFSHAKLDGSQLSGQFAHSNFSGASLKLSKISVDCRFCNFRYSSLQWAYLNIDSDGADFKGTYVFGIEIAAGLYRASGYSKSPIADFRLANFSKQDSEPSLQFVDDLIKKSQNEHVFASHHWSKDSEDDKDILSQRESSTRLQRMLSNARAFDIIARAKLENRFAKLSCQSDGIVKFTDERIYNGGDPNSDGGGYTNGVVYNHGDGFDEFRNNVGNGSVLNVGRWQASIAILCPEKPRIVEYTGAKFVRYPGGVSWNPAYMP